MSELFHEKIRQSFSLMERKQELEKLTFTLLGMVSHWHLCSLTYKKPTQGSRIPLSLREEGSLGLTENKKGSAPCPPQDPRVTMSSGRGCLHPLTSHREVTGLVLFSQLPPSNSKALAPPPSNGVTPSYGALINGHFLAKLILTFLFYF